MLTVLLFLALSGPPDSPSGVCLAGPDYYAIDLVPTRRVPGTRRATGQADVRFAASPFGVALSKNGSYEYDLDIRIENLRAPEGGAYVVWATSPDLDQVQKLGVLDATLRTEGRIALNKYLVFVTLESDPTSETWSGPVVLRGMSRSGLMHTMAGHGPFAAEPCAVYGFQ